MKKIIIFFFISVLYSAQNQRFLYDSKSYGKSEVFALDVGISGSRFHSFENHRIDSLKNLEAERQFKEQGYFFINNKELDNILFTKNYITKTYPDFQTDLFTKLGLYNYKVTDNRQINWQFSPETSVIAGYAVQKAETEMYGRKWTAWFAPKIMIQDGPYKFHGLPGLIVKITDESEDFDYQLFAVKDLKSAPDYTRSEHRPKEGKILAVDYPTYKKLFNENLQDPQKFLFPANAASNKSLTETRKDKNGKQVQKTVSKEEFNEKMQAILKNKAQKILEKDLLQ